MKKHLLLFSLILIVLSSCKKDNSAPAVQKPTIADILSNYIFSTAVQIIGSVTADGGAVVTARGVCWSTSSNPTYPTILPLMVLV